MSARTSHVALSIIVFLYNPSFRTCLEHSPLFFVTKDSCYASTEGSSRAHVLPLLHNTHSSGNMPRISSEPISAQYLAYQRSFDIVSWKHEPRTRA